MISNRNERNLKKSVNFKFLCSAEISVCCDSDWNLSLSSSQVQWLDTSSTVISG